MEHNCFGCGNAGTGGICARPEDACNNLASVKRPFRLEDRVVEEAKAGDVVLFDVLRRLVVAMDLNDL